MANITIPIGGMTCNHCVQSVKAALSEQPGVTAVDVSLEKGQAVVKGDNLNIDGLKAVIDEIGFEAGAVQQ